MLKKILIIEDTAVLAESIADCLYMEGFDVRICRNGYYALNSLKEFTPNLIITDLLMPQMDGLTFIRHFRKQNTETSIPIIVLTADTNQENIQKAMDAGANLFFHKPFEYDNLIQQIKRLIHE